jgi:M6 family metalloprotease-like protein
MFLSTSIFPSWNMNKPMFSKEVKSMLFKRTLLCLSIVSLMLCLASIAMGRPAVLGTYDPGTLRFYETGLPIIKDPDIANTLNAPARGLQKYPVLFIHGADTPETISVAEWSEQLYTVGTFESGSIRDYYREVSCNQFDIDGDVKGWYTAANAYSHYTPNNGQDGGAAELTVEAVDFAEAEGVDWSQYDNDGDGHVDAIIVIHQGMDAAAGAANQIWSHFGGIPTEMQRTYDGVIIDRYSIQAELRSATEMATIGTFVHEFGHVLGLPDLYDTEYSTTKYAPITNWCLMANGSDLGNPWGAKPAHFSGWCKYKLGWHAANYADASGNYTINATCTDPLQSIYILPINGSELEYYCIENRYPRFGGLFDRLPSRWAAGLLIYHVDEAIGGSNRASTPHWKVVAEDAQVHANASDKPNKDNGDAAFSADAGFVDFGMNSDPNTAGYYMPSGINIGSISASGMSMTFEVFYQPTLQFSSYNVNFTGNKTYQLPVEFQNLASGDANNVIGTLVCDSADIVIDTATTTFGNIGKNGGVGTNSSNPFVFHSTGTTGRLIQFRISATADNGYSSMEFTFTVPVDPSRILLVDDDQTPKGDPQLVEVYFQEAMDLIGIPYETWEVYSLGLPPSTVLSLYDLVVWEDGKSANNVPKLSTSLNSIAEFLDRGGDLFLSSHEFIYGQYPYTSDDETWEHNYTTTGDFCQKYLHISEYEQDEYFYQATGVSGSMFDGLTYQFTDVFSGDPTGADQSKYQWWPDEFIVEPPQDVQHAEVVLTAGPHQFPPDTPADSTWWADAEPGNNALEGAGCAMTYQGEHRVFFMSIPFHGIPLDGAAPLNRPEFMRRVFEWFGVSTTAPGVDIDLNQAVYHAGDHFELTLRLSNPGTSTLSADLYVLLECYGLFYFYPAWGASADSEPVTFAAGERTYQTLLEFDWPTGVGSGAQTRFWAALISNQGALLGNYDFCPMSWEP